MVSAHQFLRVLAIAALVALVAQPAGALSDGLYKISYSGPGPCQGRRLAYERYGRGWPGRVFLGSATAKSPVLWRLRGAGRGGQITLEAVNRAGCCRGKLAYPARACRSPHVIGVSKSGVMRWRPVAVDARKGTYRVHAVDREPGVCGFGAMGRLGPATAQPWARRCESGLRLWPLLRNTTGVVWKFERVAPTKVKAAGPPLPASPAPPADVCAALRPSPRVFSGRRLNSALGGIRPCYSGPGPRTDTATECCRRCTATPGCVSFMFINNALDCRSERLAAPLSACYLMDSYTGSYDPLDPELGYASGRLGMAMRG